MIAPIVEHESVLRVCVTVLAHLHLLFALLLMLSHRHGSSL